VKCFKQLPPTRPDAPEINTFITLFVMCDL
jgi:hypothetical protein